MVAQARPGGRGVMTCPEQVRARVEEALDRVVDPCSVGRQLPAGLLEMGLVDGILLTEDGEGAARVTVRARLTSPACHFQLWFDERIRGEVADVPGVSGVTVEWSKSYDWSDERMSPRLKRRIRAKRLAAGR